VGRGTDSKRVNVYNGSVVVHPSFATPYFLWFSAHAEEGCARPQGQAVLALKTQVAEATDGFTHGRVRVKGQQLSFTDGENTERRTLTRDGKTSTDRRGQQGGSLPRFP
jgi:hypothetical protein